MHQCVSFLQRSATAGLLGGAQANTVLTAVLRRDRPSSPGKYEHLRHLRASGDEFSRLYDRRRSRSHRYEQLSNRTRVRHPICEVGDEERIA